MGQLLANAAGDPSGALAVFALVGSQVQDQVDLLADFLHVLGNPVGILSAKGSYSLDRRLDLEYPLSMTARWSGWPAGWPRAPDSTIWFGPADPSWQQP